MPLILLAYEAIVVPVGLVSLHRTIARRSWKSSKRAWQYNIWSLLAVTAVAGAGAAAVRLAMQFGAPIPVTTAIGGGAATVAAIAVAIYRALRRLPPVRIQPPVSPVLGKPAHSL